MVIQLYYKCDRQRPDSRPDRIRQLTNTEILQMTYSELQKALKEMRDVGGYTLQVKLNAKKDILQAEYDRITLLECDSSEVVGQPNTTDTLNGQVCELTSAVRLPKVLNSQWFEDNYSCLLPLRPIGSSTETETILNQSEYWDSWKIVYTKAIDKLEANKQPSPQESTNEPSFGAVAITAVSIILDTVTCFADMAKQVFKHFHNQRKKAMGFAV